MPAHARAKRRCSRLLPIAAAAVTGLALTAGAAYAALNATAFNATAQSVTSGTLSLTLSNNGNGFGTTIANMAPADVVNRYVDLTAGSGLDGKAVTLSVADSGSTKLTTDATNGLHITVTQCSQAWSATAGTCGGTTTALATGVALATLKTTPSALLSGAFTAGSVLHLQMSLTLPDQTETTVNGVPPTGTIQGLTASLTWTFADVQRTATTTNS